ncbi:hypothetical protein ACRARG_14735 [Pseudooceanicola sp. C21-150M6]|uniref:hypothetical protein n=1 Tax=Pseudooceanicola sp. C21-150M6 TaxID=3434355 RepID=UPI003D7FFA45
MDKVQLRTDIDSAILAHRAYLQRIRSAAIATDQGQAVTAGTAGPRLSFGGAVTPIAEGGAVDLYLPRVQRLNSAVRQEAGRVSQQIARRSGGEAPQSVDIAAFYARSGELLRLLMQWKGSLG